MAQLFSNDTMTYRSLFELAEAAGFADKPVLVEFHDYYGDDPLVDNPVGIVLRDDGEARVIAGDVDPEGFKEEFAAEPEEVVEDGELIEEFQETSTLAEEDDDDRSID